MWDFLHDPLQSRLRERYDVHLTEPAQCARDLLAGRADLGLIPIAALTPELRIVPGCTIASLAQVRSIQLIVKQPLALADVRSVAADTASRSSVAYAEILFRHFLGVAPDFKPLAANVSAMLAIADAALVIGDPALLALEHRAQIEQQAGPCRWYDVAELWRQHTGLPWVAAVWAVRPESVPTAAARQQLTSDLTASRDHGLAHIEDLVDEWTPKIALSPATIRTYLTRNIHYTLNADCMRAIQTFRALAASLAILDPLPDLPLLQP